VAQQKSPASAAACLLLKIKDPSLMDRIPIFEALPVFVHQVALQFTNPENSAILGY
jgi:hypothetical protein